MYSDMDILDGKGFSDLIDIPKIDEIIVNNNLKLRYQLDHIYTYAGSILVAVNPYKTLNIFDRDNVFKYHTNKWGVLDPHVFALVEASYRSIINDNISQSCVISGESGAGKTETTKFILQYLCTITSEVSMWMQEQILEANTILEAFGNAKTVRNDNSSRFGKFMQVCFDSKYNIKGCVIQDYLLEQSRIIFQSPGEQNYHVLYQLIAQGQKKPEMAKEFHLRPPNFYNYLNASVLHIPQSSIDSIFKVLSAILWLGNLNFSDIDGEHCELSDDDKNMCDIITDLLSLNLNDIIRILLQRQIIVRGNITEIPLKLSEARENRHAMAKALYSRTFAWLIAKINSCTSPGENCKRFLGVLDIFGFENFSANSFEQLCINYTNEKLHKFFNNYVFTLEQDIYKLEEIKYSHVEFTDNALCLELIERPPRCIFKLLTEQCHMPKGSDMAYLSNMHTEFEHNPYYIKGINRRHWEKEFGVKHYAGCVIYTVKGFVDKNRDVQQDVLFDFMSRSENAFVKELSTFQEFQTHYSSTFQKGTSKAKTTVSEKFRQQLQTLIDVLQNTKPWYIRCIKPNSAKLPNAYSDELVLDQLKYLGMLDIIRIRKEGFPVHYNFADFCAKYKCLLMSKGKKLSKTDEILEILRNLKVSESEWQLGKTKVFLRTKAYEPLEDMRQLIINAKALIIQKTWKTYISRKRYTRIRTAALKIQHAYRGWKLRIQFLRIRRATIIIQCHLRGVFAREVAAALREMRRVDEEMKKREISPVSYSSGQSVQAIEDCERLVEEEMNLLSELAEQINLARPNIFPSPITKCDKQEENLNESVDLDNLFAFLNEVTSTNTTNPILEELSDKMDNLVQDFNTELQNCNKQQNNAEKVESSSPVQDKIEEIETLEQKAGVEEEEITRKKAKEEGRVEDDTDKEIIDKENKNEINLPMDNSFRKERSTPVSPIYEAVMLSPLASRFNNSNDCNPGHLSSPNDGNKEMVKREMSPSALKQRPRIHKTAKLQDVSAEREQRRKYRVEKKLLQIHQGAHDILGDMHNSDIQFDIMEFINNYFNIHEKPQSNDIIATLTRKNKKVVNLMSNAEMISFQKYDKIPSSHIHMYDPENVVLSCDIFHELHKYMRGEVNADQELEIIQYIIGLGIEREELRDEIFVQCIRQLTNNPSVEWSDRLWLLMCLLIVAFQPSKLFFRYYVSYLKKNLGVIEGKFKQYAQWCYDNCKCTKISSRALPPSRVEVAAMRRLGTIVCRFFFLDGRTKAIDVHPNDTAADAVTKLAVKLNLLNTEGWAIFQSRPDGEVHIKSFDYLYDIIASWELKQTKTTGTITNRKVFEEQSSGENRFVFRKRLFKSSRELSQDPMEINLLYAQAVYSVVKCDEYPVSEKVALQLAGLQAQVALGDPSQQPKLEYYNDIKNFLPERIFKTREHQFWIPILAQAHRQYGASRNELTAKVLYLSCVMQYPLYGCTMFNIVYRGYWNHGSNIIFGVNCDAIMFIQPEDKCVLYQYKYLDIESIILDPSDNFITITLNRQIQHTAGVHVGSHRSFVFETSQKNEIGSLIVSYYPPLSSWIMNNNEMPKKLKAITNEDRARLYQNIVICRRQLIDADILRKPQETGGGFIRSTLRRLSKHRLEKLKAEHGNNVQDHGETYNGFPHSFWAFSRQQIVQSLMRLAEPEEIIMLQIFQSVLVYAGLGVTGENIQRAEDEHVTIAQSIMEKCMRKESLVNELYLQLIKQTTDHPDPNSRVNLRHWALLSLTCSVVLPPTKSIKKYLICHLKRCASDYLTEEGKYARFSEKCFFQTEASPCRQWPPSRDEILCTINRRPCYAKFHFMDGKFYSMEFLPSSTAAEVMEIIRKKIGLEESSRGYAIYEVLGNTERCLLPEEKITDIMAKWEKYRYASDQELLNMSQAGANSCRSHHYMFLFKKHLFYDAYINLDDPVEKELTYHQVLHSLRTERFPITEMEAIMLTALQSQVELGDCNQFNNYKLIARHCLPPRFVLNIPQEAVTMHHQSLRGMTPAEAKKSFLNLIHSWPLHRASIFDVMQSFTSNWPRIMWLAVDQNGIHLLEHRSRNVLCTHDYQSIISYSPNMNSLMIFTGTEKKQSKIILSTVQAFQIASLIKEYSEIVKLRK